MRLRLISIIATLTIGTSCADGSGAPSGELPSEAGANEVPATRSPSGEFEFVSLDGDRTAPCAPSSVQTAIWEDLGSSTLLLEALCSRTLGLVRVPGGAQIVWYAVTFRGSPDGEWSYLGAVSFAFGFDSRAVFDSLRELRVPESDAIAAARLLNEEPDWSPGANTFDAEQCAGTVPTPWRDETTAGTFALCFSRDFAVNYAKLLPSGSYYEAAVYRRTGAQDPWRLVLYDQFDWTVFDPDCRTFWSLVSGERVPIQQDRGNPYERVETLSETEAALVANGYSGGQRDLPSECGSTAATSEG